MCIRDSPMAESFYHATRRRASFRQDAAVGPDVRDLDTGSNSSEDDDSCFANIPGSDDEDKKGAAKGGAEKGVTGARSKARATKRATK